MKKQKKCVFVTNLFTIQGEDDQHEVFLHLVHDSLLKIVPVLVRGHVVLHLVHHNGLSDVLNSLWRPNGLNQSVYLMFGLLGLRNLLDKVHNNWKFTQHQSIVFWISWFHWRLQFLISQFLNNFIRDNT